MQACLVGYSKMDGTSKRTNKPYSGYMLHLVYEDSNVTGEAVHSQFVDSSLIDFSLELGRTLQFTYETNFNGYSKLVGVEIVE